MVSSALRTLSSSSRSKDVAATRDDSDDGDAPVAMGIEEARKAALAREADQPSQQSVRDGQKAAQQQKQKLVTASLRGEDYLPTDILDQLPETSASPAKIPPKVDSSASQTRKKRSLESSESAARPDSRVAFPGLPRVVRDSGPVAIAVVEHGGSSCGHAGPRLHAPVRADIRDFLNEQLYGTRNRRAPTATIASLKPSRGRFGPASNFVTVPVVPNEEISKAKKRKTSNEGRSSSHRALAGHSTLEKLAAKIMGRKKR